MMRRPRLNVNAIPRNIRARMDDIGIPDVVLSRISGVRLEALRKYLDEEKIPSIFSLYQIAAVLGCSMEDLMEGVYLDDDY